MKALIFITALLFFTVGGVYFLSDPEGKAQTPPAPPVKPKENIEKSFDERLNRVENKVSEVEMIKPKPRVIIKKVTVIKEVPAEEHKSLLTIGGDQYEVEPTVYKGYNIYNVDSIQKAIVDEEIEYAMLKGDTVKGAAMSEAKERINLWKRVISLFKHKKSK